MRGQPDTIIEYWFGDSEDDLVVAETRSSLWWSKNTDTDKDIEERFGSLVVAAETGALDTWRSSALGCLALIILTDQFPRNIYRDTPDAFRFDSISRKLCLEMISADKDEALRPIYRAFLYMPLQHSEKLEHQNLGIQQYQILTSDAPGTASQVFEGFLAHAHQHRNIIERFGRFPHRNKILQRTSSPEEIAFLQEPGSSF